MIAERLEKSLRRASPCLDRAAHRMVWAAAPTRGFGRDIGNAHGKPVGER